jgi:hypothetical protein
VRTLPSYDVAAHAGAVFFVIAAFVALLALLLYSLRAGASAIARLMASGDRSQAG